MMKNLCKNFLKCGVAGWCMEIVYTALISLKRRQLSLKGETSLWMFPVYGSVSLFAPAFRLLRSLPFLLRGCVYASFIFTGEYLSGILLSRKKVCPWNYGRSRWHIRKLIRLDFFPHWFLAGLLFERLLAPDKHKAV